MSHKIRKSKVIRSSGELLRDFMTFRLDGLFDEAFL